MPRSPLVVPGPPLSADQANRYSRHLLLSELGELGQRSLLAARVGVVGAGGLGSPALLYLAAAGVGTLGIIDDDTVEVSNLQRQIIHAQADIGRAKAVSAAESVTALAPDVHVRAHVERLTPENAVRLLGGYDLILDGTDNFDTRYLVADTCAELGLPLVWGSILRFDAQVSVFWSSPNDGSPGVQLRDLFPAPPASGTVESCSTAGVLGAMCGQVGGVMAAEAVKLITGAGTPLIGRVLVLDALNARWSEVPFVPSTPSTASAPSTPSAPSVSRDEDLISFDQIQELTRTSTAANPLVVVDVREPDEFAAGAVPGARLLPLAEALTERGRASLSTESTVVLYCHRGSRARTAATAFREAGFTDVRVLEGGYAGWAARQTPISSVVKPSATQPSTASSQKDMPA